MTTDDDFKAKGFHSKSEMRRIEIQRPAAPSFDHTNPKYGLKPTTPECNCGGEVNPRFCELHPEVTEWFFEPKPASADVTDGPRKDNNSVLDVTPREWWVYEALSRFKDKDGAKTLGLSVYDQKMPISDSREFHVIERSAFDAVVKERESYYHDFRVKYDIETKQLREQVARLEGVIETRTEAARQFERELADTQRALQELCKINSNQKAENAELRKTKDFDWETRIGRELTAARALLETQTHNLSIMNTEWGRFKAALEWIAGVDEEKPYCTYYERTLDDGTVIPTVDEIAREALAKEQP